MSGHAVHCQPIKMKWAEFTYKEIEHLIKKKYPDIQLAAIGSLGKKDEEVETGDIDIAIVCDSKEKVKEMLENTLGDCIHEINMNTTPKVMSISYFIGNWSDAECKCPICVQVDFMLVDNLEWALWRFQSPDLKNGESKYKADPKVFLQSYMVSALPIYAPIEYFEDGVTVQTRFKYTLNQEGLIIQKLNYMGKKGKPVKNPTRELYKFVTNKPEEIMGLLFKNGYNEEWFHCVEKLWDALHLHSTYGEDYIYDVEKRFYEDYVNNERSECKLNPKEFPCMYYQVA